MKSLYYFLTALICVSNPIRGAAQNVIFKEADTYLGDYTHAIFTDGNHQYVSINYESPHGMFTQNRSDRNTLITGYDKNLKQLYSIEEKELKNYKFVAGIHANTGIFLFYLDKNNIVKKFSVDPATGKITAFDANLFSIADDDFRMYKTASPDNKYHVLCLRTYNHRQKSMSYSGVVLDGNMNTVYSFDFTNPEDIETHAGEDIVLNNQGTFFFIHSIPIKEGKLENNATAYLIQYGDKNRPFKSINLQGIPKGRYLNIAWKPIGDGLEFTSLYSTSAENNFSKIVSGIVEFKTGAVSNVKSSDFLNSPLFTSHSLAIYKYIGTNGIPVELPKLNSFSFDDGSSALLMEDYGYWRFQSGGTTNNKGDVVVLKINPKKELENVFVITKSQSEIEYTLFTGSAALKDSKDGIHIFFHDNPAYKEVAVDGKQKQIVLQGRMQASNLAHITITKDGQISKKFELVNEGRELYFSPVGAYSPYPNELIYSAYEKKNAGKSKYRVGTLTITP